MPSLPYCNKLLDILPEHLAKQLLREGTELHFPLGTSLFDRSERPRFAYFLTSGISSIVFSSERGTSVELATEGCEGLVGWLNLLGPGILNGSATMQISGSGWRVPAVAVQREFDSTPEIRQRILEYIQYQTVIANQVLACNRLHRAEARFSRWLLMVGDRIQSDHLPMTQEFMSMMLGTRRTTVAEVSSTLARAGAVEGRRGGLRIANRAALESRACECYGIIRSGYAALYQDPPR